MMHNGDVCFSFDQAFPSPRAPSTDFDNCDSAHPPVAAVPGQPKTRELAAPAQIQGTRGLAAEALADQLLDQVQLPYLVGHILELPSVETAHVWRRGRRVLVSF